MKVTHCRLCKSTDLTNWLDLGHHPHSDQFRKTKDEPETQYPLQVLVCNNCGLSQLSYVVNKEVMYTEDYLYESSITKTANEHWGKLVDDVIKRTGIESGSSVDVGGNDGTLSLKFKERGFDVTNIDPCKEVADISKKRGVNTINDFFSQEAVKKLKPVDIITGTNVFAHVHDLFDFMTNVKTLLKKNGVFIFESPYFGDFYDKTEYDTIYHQHLSYLSLKPLIKFFALFDMEIFDVVFSDLHGGAFRCYIARKGERKVQPIVKKVAEKENWDLKALNKFAEKTKKHRDDLMSLLWKFKGKNKSIAIVSSPAKGMTMMNYCGMKENLIDFITEKSKLKIGRFTPGSHIEILPDEELIKRQPDYAIILAWNFANEIMKNNPKYKGKWIIPVNKIKII
jgi:SAM-dependent methyltransferase